MSTTNAIDALVPLCVMGGLVYVMYRVWSPIWTIATLLLKLALFGGIAVAIMLYFWPDALVHIYGLAGVLSLLRGSWTLRVIYALLADMFQAAADIDWGRLRHEWSDEL